MWGWFCRISPSQHVPWYASLFRQFGIVPLSHWYHLVSEEAFQVKVWHNKNKIQLAPLSLLVQSVSSFRSLVLLFLVLTRCMARPTIEDEDQNFLIRSQDHRRWATTKIWRDWFGAFRWWCLSFSCRHHSDIGRTTYSYSRLAPKCTSKVHIFVSFFNAY